MSCLISEGHISSGPGRANRIGEHSIHAPTRSRDPERFLKITVRHITDGQVKLIIHYHVGKQKLMVILKSLVPEFF